MSSTARAETEYLDCPACGTPAVPASSWSRQHGCGTWCEDDTAVCPGCGVTIGVRLTGDEDNGEYVEAVVEDSSHE